MTKLTYQEAVAQAVQFLQSNQIVAISIGETDKHKEIEHANQCGRCFEHLKFVLGRQIQKGWSISPEYMSWLGDVLTGTIEKPPIGGGRGKDPSNELTILAAVSHLVDAGLNPTRNEEKNGPHDSACDAVADAMRILKRRTRSYSRIKEIWTKRGKNPRWR